MVIHKKHGKGQVVSREVKENGAYITVEFEDGKVMKMAIPDSFEKDCVEAQGVLKEEVEKALVVKRELQEKLALERLAAKTVTVSAPAVAKTKRVGRKPTKKLTVKSTLQVEFEEYLKNAGYPVVGVSGNDSTVPAYSKSVEKVIENENITWDDLKNNISNIIVKYDVGGTCEDFGRRGHRRIINALYRFAEMIDFKKI